MRHSDSMLLDQRSMVYSTSDPHEHPSELIQLGGGMDWDAELTASSSLQRRRELTLGVPGNALEADMQPSGRRADGKLRSWHMLLQPTTTRQTLC